MIHIEKLLENIKNIENFTKDTEVANLLQLKTDALVQRKKRNSIPHDNVIKYCLRKNISLDLLYENHIYNENSETTENKEFCKIKVIDKGDYIKLPIENLEDNHIAYINQKNKLIYIADTNCYNFSEDGVYLILYNERYFAKKITTKFNQKLLIQDINSSDNDNIIEEEALSNINIIGKIAHTVTITD